MDLESPTPATAMLSRPGPGFSVPFLLGDGALLVVGWSIYAQGARPMAPVEVIAFAGCVALGAWMGIWPFILRARAELKAAELNTLGTSAAALHGLEEAVRRIETSTGHWQTAQEHAAGTMTAAREIADRIEAEHKAFHDFLQQAHDTEREHLRLEVSKLRRAEGEWLQVLVRVFDHVYALCMAGVRSGQPQLAEQLGHFQSACRDAARRIGLVALAFPPGAPFDPQCHQVPEGVPGPAPGELIGETLATGYTFQGQLLRKALVTVGGPQVPVDSGTDSTLSFGMCQPESEPPPASREREA